MTKGLKDGEPNGREVYADIIDHPHWQSPTRPHMSLADRAAQFSPFDALTGYTDMVREEQRLTDKLVELDENSLAVLDRKMSQIASALEKGEQPLVTITHFVPDQNKAGGSYRTTTGNVRKIDQFKRQLQLITDGSPSQVTAVVPAGMMADPNVISLSFRHIIDVIL